MTDLYSTSGPETQEQRYTFVDAGGKDVTAEVYAEAEHLQTENHEKALEARARRAAMKAGFIARKSRSQIGNTLVNQGGFQILDGFSGFPVLGWTFDLSAQDVIEWCADDTE